MKSILFFALTSVACSSSGSVGRLEMCTEPTETSGNWVSMALPPANLGAIEPAFSWTGHEFIAWGGLGLHTENGGCVPCYGGGAYDPQTNSWRALTSIGAPTTPEYASGVWTGTSLFVWGGLPPFSHPITPADQVGGMYDVARDEWQSVSTDGQPRWRWQHALVWTGKEVLVWGGAAPDNTHLCDGGRFDPVSNTWTPMSLIGAPPGCLQPATAWTGTELLVWGGSIKEADAGETNAGAAYNPQADAWRPLNNVGAPSPRTHPAVVWTGQEMIVYGGNAGVDARAYDPVADRWRSLSLHGNPGLHTRGDAVWTGSEMILWGRSDCDVGGRYDVASDTWRPFSSRGVLKPRRDQSIVWTGDAVLIYGGTIGVDIGEYDTNSGALYAP